MDEIRFVAGPIIGRFQDKVEEDRQAVLKIEEEKAAKKRAEIEARKKAEEEAKKAKEPKKEDAEMKDADAPADAPQAQKADGVEEPGDTDMD